MGSRLPALVFLAATSCASAYVLRGAPVQPFDAVIVPGCPSLPNGALSRCQMGRAGFAAILWAQGAARNFIVSGGAVHTPFIEAAALAEAMVALGVPANRILIEANAFHTDENMYFSLQIARALSLRRVAVASSAGHAAWGCHMLAQWGQPCVALSLDHGTLTAFLPRHEAALREIRSARVADWTELGAREEVRETRTGQARPPSYLLYPMLGVLRLNGAAWKPFAPKHPRLLRWNDLAQKTH